mmetsp:Transcript_38470/g.102368  ORF Transcript_38470/g.102368 Transcript_38470/m.102368 type:complete len:242 (+) Transcript_38470:648-1373(+)
MSNSPKRGCEIALRLLCVSGGKDSIHSPRSWEQRQLRVSLPDEQRRTMHFTRTSCMLSKRCNTICILSTKSLTLVSISSFCNRLTDSPAFRDSMRCFLEQMWAPHTYDTFLSNSLMFAINVSGLSKADCSSWVSSSMQGTKDGSIICSCPDSGSCSCLARSATLTSKIVKSKTPPDRMFNSSSFFLRSLRSTWSTLNPSSLTSVSNSITAMNWYSLKYLANGFGQRSIFSTRKTFSTFSCF